MSTIAKALDLLNCFSPTRAEIGLAAFTRMSGRDKATVHRHLTELHGMGFLEQDPETRAYRLGPALLRLSAVREAAFPVRQLLRPIVTALAEEVGELAHASLLQGAALSPVFHADPQRHGTQVHFDPSEMLPLHATSSGLAILAFAPELCDEVLSRPLKRHTAHTVVAPETIQRLLEQARRTGLSQLDRAFDNEVSSQGAPLFGRHGTVVGALSVAVPTARATPERLQTIAPALAAAARAASHSLGSALDAVPAVTSIQTELQP